MRFNSDAGNKDTKDLIENYRASYDFPFARMEMLREIRQRANFEEDNEAQHFLNNFGGE